MSVRQALRGFAVGLFFTSSTCFAFSIPFIGIGPRESTFPWWAVDGTPINVTAYGDSILSGLDRDHEYGFIAGRGLVERFGVILANTNPGSMVSVHNRAVAGSQSPSIIREMMNNAQYLPQTDYLILDGGGNDFLQVLEHPSELCTQSGYDNIDAITTANWNTMVDFANERIPSRTKSIYMTLHFGKLDQIKAMKCPDGAGSPYPQVLTAIARMNYEIARLATVHHAFVIDDFGSFNCDPSVRETCDPRKFATVDEYVAQLKAYDAKGLIVDASHWQGDVMSPPINLLQKDEIHPNALGHLLLSDRLFDLFGL